MLSARGIERRYRGRPVLAIDRLDLAPGSTTALVGPNGSGKSTLLRILALVERPDAGSVFLDQRPVVTERDRRRGRRVVTLVEQRPLLFSGTVRANLLYALGLHGDRGDRAAARVTMALERLGVGALANRETSELSDGEVQRVAVARACCLEPRVLLLDEPLAAADRVAERALHETLASLREAGVASCVASHRVEDAFRWSDRVLSLAGGRLTPVTPENLFRAVLPPGPPERSVRIGPIELNVVTDHTGPVSIVIPPDDIVVSREPSESSARNQYRGRVTRVSDDRRGTVTLGVDVGVELVVRITHGSLERLGLKLGTEVVLAVKSVAVRVH
jgi:tungstate transport system ATP-binding protein